MNTGAPRGALHGRGARVLRATFSTRSAPRSRRARSGSPGRTAPYATRPGSSSCSPPTRARAHPRTTATACARRWCAAVTSGGCPGRCWTASTCGPACIPITALSAVGEPAEDTATVRARVLTAREAAADRWAVHGWRCNAEVPGPALRGVRAARVGRPAAGRRSAQRRADGARGRPRVARRLDRRRTCGGSPGRTATASSRRCTSAIGGPHERRGGAVPEGASHSPRCSGLVRTLSRVAEPPAPGLAAFVEAVGPVGGRVPGPGRRRARSGGGGDRRPPHGRPGGRGPRPRRAAGARLLVPEDAAWPREAFAACVLCGAAALAPPVALWVRGPRRR